MRYVRHLCTLLFVATAAYVQAQGSGVGLLSFNTVGVTQDKRIWVSGESGEGALASGSQYQVALYFAQSGTSDESQFVQVGQSVGFLTGTAAGTFLGGSRTLVGLPVNGAIVALQARAWCAAGGMFPTYEAAVINGSPAGEGPIFDFKTKDPYNINESVPTIGQAAGWRGFYVGNLGEAHVCVPEPSTITLAALAVTYLAVRRKRR